MYVIAMRCDWLCVSGHVNMINMGRWIPSYSIVISIYKIPKHIAGIWIGGLCDKLKYKINK